MLITRARVTNYRSVIDSEYFEVEPRKTILVGVNEAGKTAVLKALQSINATADTPPLDFLFDYPRSRLNEIQRGTKTPSEIKVAEATFALSDADRAAVASKVQLDETATITWHKYLDNDLRYSVYGFPSSPTFGDVTQDLIRLRSYLAAHDSPASLLTLLDEIGTNNGSEPLAGDVAATIKSALTTALPLIDEEDGKETTRWAKIEELASKGSAVSEAVAILRTRIPLLVYYSTYFTVRPRIDLESLAARQERGDVDNEYDFGNLCLLKLLGFTARELSSMASGPPTKPNYYETDGDVRKEHDIAVVAYQRKLDSRQYQLNAASVTLTKDLRRVWGDETLQLRIVADGQYLKVMVVDDLGVEVELDQRSEGFRWLVSFFVVFRSQAQDDLEGAILLLDEPGLSLHALKQQEFRKTISLLGEDNQIIYSTHSPFMVGSDELDLVRIAEMKDRAAGTKIHSRLQVDDPRSVFPLQAALGYELAQSMFSQKKNLVCEGVTDMFYLNSVNEASTAEGAATLKNSPAIIPAGTASKVAYFCTIYAGQSLEVAALLDSDGAGDLAAQQDALVALLPKKAVLRVADFLATPVSGAEIEDMFRTTLATIAKSLGWDSSATISAQPSRPIMQILSAEHGKPVSKWKLAKAFMTWIGTNGYSALTTDERNAWSKLTSAVNKAL
ncbi:AAA family ATPase [Cryobacterium ruanii]|uniref:OLD family endonuclease n=1 Tax=Cryobacterium ruanii TaxID=1259197 RepID=A0A4R9ASA2_9MICO|nr:AAA family ATPase [Cryobacterium ruanii]TFD68495.1 OLD family endonuclease [Cryobacterium ruanii]